MHQHQADPVACLHDVSKRYGNVVALDRVDLTVQRGELLAVLGPNGAGKSTAINLLLGLIRADAGQVRLFGFDPHDIAARRHIGVMLQAAELPHTLRVGEMLALVSSYYPNPRSVAESARLAGVGDLLSRPCKKLSGGQQRRVQFALALCGRPALLFLDEPTTSMDVEARQALWAAMRALVADGVSVVLSTHYLEEAEALAQRVVVLGRGRVLGDGSVDELRARIVDTQVRCFSFLDAGDVAMWSDVEAAWRDQAHLCVATARPESVIGRLLAADPALTGLEVKRAGLAEALRDLVHEPPSRQQEAA